MTTLGTRLNSYIERHDRKQAEVAATWLERWTGQGGKTWSDATITSQLNRLLKDSAQGVQFFFQDRPRGALLLEVLQVPESEHPDLFELADRALRSEGAPARIVVDATGWPQSMERADALFGELKRLLVVDGPYPITLVILDDQYDRLPRSFDEYKDKVRIVRVHNSKEGWERTQELADEQGLVLSTHRFPIFERWLAADFDGKTLRIEPPNGLALFRSQGRLPSLEPVTHDLSALIAPGTEQSVRLTQSGGALHQLMRALRTEEGSAQLELDAATRQGAARALKIAATSTAQERLTAMVEALKRELPVKLTAGSAADLQAHLDRAQRRKTEPLALHVGDAVHLINVPTATQLSEGRSWVHVHDIQAQPSALSQLLDAVGPWNELDFLTDPFLDRLIARLVPDEKNRNALLHARAGLLLTQALQPKVATPLVDWIPALKELLEAEPPSASLRCHMQGKKIRYADRERMPFIVTEAQAHRIKQARSLELHQLPPVGDVLLTRQDTPLTVEGADLEKQQRNWRTKHLPAPPVLLPSTPEYARDLESWLDIYEASNFSSNAWREKGPELWDTRSEYLLSGKLSTWSTSPLSIAEEVWEEADQALWMAWLAMRAALLRPQSLRLPDGAVLLRLGGSFFAELRIYALSSHRGSAQVQGSLLIDIECSTQARGGYGEQHSIYELSALSALVTTHTVKGGYDFGAKLPRRINLFGERYCADIRFRGSALFSEAPQPLDHAAAMARIKDEQKQAAAKQQQAADDDDDDYDDSDDY